MSRKHTHKSENSLKTLFHTNSDLLEVLIHMKTTKQTLLLRE